VLADPHLADEGDFADRFETGVSPQALADIAHVSRTLDEMLNRSPDRHAPYVGESAFATKAGIHASAILKDPTTYEHVAPERVGNRRRVMVSDQAGKSNVIAELERLGVPVEECDDGMDITGVERLGGGEMESFGDHRIAMSLSVAALVANGGITVKDIDCVATSFPTFFPLLEKVAVR